MHKEVIKIMDTEKISVNREKVASGGKNIPCDFLRKAMGKSEDLEFVCLCGDQLINGISGCSSLANCHLKIMAENTPELE